MADWCLGWFGASVQVAHMLSRQLEPESERAHHRKLGVVYFLAETITELY